MPSRPFIDLGPIIGGLQGALIAPTITMTPTDGIQAALQHFANQYGSPERFLLAAATEYRNYMVENKLSGQRLKRRSGRLAGAWQPTKLSDTEYLLSAGRLPYSRVHQFGLDYPFQPVRGYTTASGKKVPLYLRHMKLRATNYVSETIIEAHDRVLARLQIVQNNIGGRVDPNADSK